MKKVFSARTVGFYLGLNACLAALAGAVGLVATDMGDRTFSWITIALMGGGIVFGCINGVTDLAIAPLLSTLCIGCGFCWHLYIGLRHLERRQLHRWQCAGCDGLWRLLRSCYAAEHHQLLHGPEKEYPNRITHFRRSGGSKNAGTPDSDPNNTTKKDELRQ